jgi:hypothetical protein
MSSSADGHLPYVSWDGLEDEEKADFDRAVRDITNIQNDVAARRARKTMRKVRK